MEALALFCAGYLIALALIVILVGGPRTFNPLAGISGFVKISTTAYAFTKWSVEMRCNIVKANNFTGGGYQQIVAGLVSATLTLEALSYDEGNMAFTAGQSYAFTLGYTVSITLTLTVLIESITPTIDYEGNENIKIVGQSNGSFTAGIL